MYKPARRPTAKYICSTDVANEPSAKPVSPVIEPVMQTIRDPYCVSTTLMKIPVNDSSSSSSISSSSSSKSFNFTNNLYKIYSNLVYSTKMIYSNVIDDCLPIKNAQITQDKA